MHLIWTKIQIAVTALGGWLSYCPGDQDGLLIALVGLGHVLDTHVVGTGSALRSAVICFYMSNEGVSLLENASHLGLPVPKKLKEVLSQLDNKHEKDKDE
ncbi:MAG: phage holin family protein, partial [Clostridia bacterium]|nr:phage holin family protein [Clostridia bacterium]